MGIICSEAAILEDASSKTNSQQKLQFEPVYNFTPFINTLVKERIKKQQSEHSGSISHLGISLDDEHLAIPMREVNKDFVYVGQWHRNQPNGRGKIYFSNGDYFNGEFREGVAFGKGLYIYNTGSYFEGHVENNEAKGEGKYSSADVEFEGFWDNSRPFVGSYHLMASGIVVEIRSPNHGTILYPTQDKYEGELNSKLHPSGYGRMTYKRGNYYEGDWVDGQMYGNGTFKWSNGKSYSGEYKQGKRHGIGRYYNSGEQYYEGQWQYGRQHGKGKLVDKENVLQCLFENGAPVQLRPLNDDIQPVGNPPLENPLMGNPPMGSPPMGNPPIEEPSRGYSDRDYQSVIDPWNVMSSNSTSQNGLPVHSRVSAGESMVPGSSIQIGNRNSL